MAGAPKTVTTGVHVAGSNRHVQAFTRRPVDRQTGMPRQEGRTTRIGNACYIGNACGIGNTCGIGSIAQSET
jgi:hypothetical protein